MSDFFSTANISASGLSAERMRMQVIASNIANASTTRTESGEPYRRQQVVFSSMMDSQLGEVDGRPSRLGGVQILGVQPDMSRLPQLFDPGHPDSDDAGMVTMPNVSIAREMVDMITASRSYEANLQALRSLRSMVENTLSLLRA